MVLKELFAAQKELDERIINEHKLQEKDLFSDKVVSFIVELGELSNEIRWFKHWSRKGPSEREAILEEYIDSIHFVLSIGNDLSQLIDYDLQNRNYETELSYKGFTDEFIHIVRDICTLQNMVKQYKKLKANNLDGLTTKELIAIVYTGCFERLLMFGYKLGFSFKDIEMAYYKKHEINFTRQDQGY